MRVRAGLWIFLVLAGLLCFLGTLQYRWITKLADAEAEREQQALQTALNQLASAFDTEITRAQLAFGAFPMQAPTPEFWAERYQNWRDFAPYPRVLKDVVIEQDGQSFVVGPTGLTPGGVPAQTGENPVVVQPRRFFRMGPPEMGGPPDRPPPPDGSEGPRRDLHSQGVRMLVYDAAYIRTEFLPKLVARFLPTDRYGIKITSGDEPIYSQGEFVAGITSRMFSFRPECFGGGSGRGEHRRRGPGMPPGQFGPSFLARAETNCPDLGPNEPGSGRWVVEAGINPALRTGIGQFRTRSLLVSFGVLGILGAGIAMLGLYGHRAQVLAQRQMEFAMAVSHELRTPLTVIRVAADNLAEGLVSDSKRYGELIRREAVRLTDMVEQVLVFARTRTDVTPNFAQVRPVEVIDRALAASAGSLESAGMSVERSIPEDLPAIRADLNLISAGVQNVLVNAAKYARSGGIVRVSVDRLDSQVRISVQDDGPGVRSSDLRRIFTPFYRSAEAANSKVPGLGLGLHLVKRIVEAHGGVIQAGNGSTGGFVIEMRLPVVE